MDGRDANELTGNLNDLPEQRATNQAPGYNNNKQSSTGLLKDYIIGHKYVNSLQNFDNKNSNDQLIQYFSIVGMDDADIGHTIMTVKDMVYSGYNLKESSNGDIVNQGILRGEMPYIPYDKNTQEGSSNYLPRFKVPKFQPRVLSRVPSIERSKMMFPINLPDFIFEDGIQVLSISDFGQKLIDYQTQKENQIDLSPFLTNFVDSKNSDRIIPENGIQREMLYTNQEGKMFFATCHDFFVDLAELDRDLQKQGFAKDQQKVQNEEVAKIIATEIPEGRYYIPFTMCLISLQSYKYQFMSILDALHQSQTTNILGSKLTMGNKSFEQLVNMIVFGIPSPPRRFEYLNKLVIPTKDKSKSSQEQQTAGKPIIEIALTPYSDKKVYIQNENPFDQSNCKFENIWVLLDVLTPENVIMVFKRLLFNTCNILVSDNAEKLNKCIQGVIELFYPLTCDVIAIPNLPLTMLQYVSMCGQCVLGVVQQKKDSDKNKDENYKKAKVSVHSSAESVIDLFDIMQDNACQMDLDSNHSIQKPRQVVAFNTKGRLAQGQGAAQSLTPHHNYTNLSQNALLRMQQQYGNNRTGGPENLNDIELPKENTRLIRDKIKSATKDSDKKLAKLDDAIRKLKSHFSDMNVQRSNQMASSKDAKKIQECEKQIQSCLFEFQKNVRTVKFEFYEMIRTILQCYCRTKEDLMEFYRENEQIKEKDDSRQWAEMKRLGKDNEVMLTDFHGGDTQSGYMPKYIKWQADKDIFKLVDRKNFKKNAKDLNQNPLYDQVFYQRFIYYPSLQNFITEKFFPLSIDDNIRQLHIVRQISKNSYQIPVDSKLALEGKKLENNDKEILRQQRDLFDPNDPKSKHTIYIFGKSFTQQEPRLEKQQFLSQFPRNINEVRVRNDHQQNHQGNRSVQKLGLRDSQFNGYLKRPKKEMPIAPVVDMKTRATLYMDQLSSRVNIIISWLYMFIGSLDYQLNPVLFKQIKAGLEPKVLDQQNYKSSKYYDSRANLEQMLAAYFEKVLKLLVYKFSYEFNPKCPLLSMLFQYTHNYQYLHQKLIDIVHQDIDQQQGGGGAGGNMSVSNSFVIYQLHWESKQLRLSALQQKKLREAERFEGLKEKVKEVYGNKQNKQKIDSFQKTKEIVAWGKDTYGKNLLFNDPFVLNEKVDQQWTYSKDRIDLLKKLAERDEEYQLNKENCKNDSESNQIQSSYSSNDQPMGKEKKAKTGFLSLKKIFGIKTNSSSQREKNVINPNNYTTGVTIGGESIRGSTAQLRGGTRVSENDLIRGGINKSDYSQIRYNLEDQILKSRSFISPQQIQEKEKKSKNRDFEMMGGEGNLDKGIGELSAKQIEELDIKVDLDLELPDKEQDQRIAVQKLENNYLNLKGKKNNNPGKVEDINSGGKNQKKKESNQVKIVVTMSCSLGVYELFKVDLIEPNYLRLNVETALGVDKQFKTIQQVDLSVLSQSKDKSDITLYWNMIFWFKFIGLPYLQFAPFIEHLVPYDIINDVSDLPESMQTNPDCKQPKQFWAHHLLKMGMKYKNIRIQTNTGQSEEKKIDDKTLTKECLQNQQQETVYKKVEMSEKDVKRSAKEIKMLRKKQRTQAAINSIDDPTLKLIKQAENQIRK